ncbi:hypothetical protein E1263_20305 [Kribbella antibiotica]|uniref:HEAT repeat domain-containing protein n=1 Tax=Kribbella antibiotica TaxID=190195 RepID=A0A4R4ZI95_9ACTN|nr:HEAT repeat domain-containing protein [Kribbella antibiotica]TDD58175.1 hypothetical protein E1263_20305 [Kribbella antibiotica]
MATVRAHPREVVAAACAAHGEDTVVDWAVAFLTGEIPGEDAYGADLPKLVALTGSANPGGWAAPVDPVNYYWIRVWAARVLLYAWRDDAAEALAAAADDPAWRVREHVARVIAKHELSDLVEYLVALVDDEVPRVRAAAERALDRLDR